MSKTLVIHGTKESKQWSTYYEALGYTVIFNEVKDLEPELDPYTAIITWRDLTKEDGETGNGS